MDKDIHQAAAAGDLDSVRVYLESRGDVNIQDAEGLTPLHQAGRNGHRNVVEKLLRSGAKIDKKTKNGCTPLRTTCFFGHLNVIEVLIESGADVNLPCKDGATPLFVAARNGHLPVLEKLLSSGAYINKSAKAGWTPLHTASAEGHADVVSTLLRSGADIDMQNKTGSTPLYIAAQEGHLPVLEKLLSCGAEINKSREDGATPLYIAAQNGHLPVLEKLLSCGAEINKSEEIGWAPLHVAAFRGHEDVVDYLIRSGSAIDIQENDGWSPLHIAASRGYIDLVDSLLRSGAAIDMKDETGRTPLHCAAENNHSVIVEELVLHGTEMDIRNKNGKTAKEIAGDEARKVIEEYEEVLKKVPKEIKVIGKKAVLKYLKALKRDAAVSNVIHVMLVGHFGVGKTTIAVNLLNKKDKKTKSTDGIEVHINQCMINMETGEWHIKEETISEGEHDAVFMGMAGFIRLNIVDFAGQFIFYTTHQTYLTCRGLYLLVFNLAMGLEGAVEDDDTQSAEKQKLRVIDFLEFWIATITTYARSDHDGFPKIILIGTHRDEVKDESDLRRIKQEIDSTFHKAVESGQLVVREDLFISAHPMDESSRKVIQDVILHEGMSYKEFGEKIPMSWVALQEKMMVLKRRRCNIITIEELKQMNKDLSIPLDDEELTVFLKFMHNIGQIVYFSISGLGNKIILDPKTIIDAMRCFITHKGFVKAIKRMIVLRHMRKTGEIKISEILRIWKEKQLEQHSEHLLGILQRLDLICDPVIYRCGQKVPSDVVYVPSMIQSAESNDPMTGIPKGSKREVTFSSETILPPAIFNRLACSCLALWPVVNKHLYQGSVLFKVGKNHFLRLKRKGNDIFVTFARKEEGHCPDGQLCLAIKDFLTQTLERILDLYKTSTETPIVCKYSDIDTLEDVQLRGASGGDDKRSTDASGDDDERSTGTSGDSHRRSTADECQCDEYITKKLDDVTLMRIADRLQGIDLGMLCSALLNDDSVSKEIRINYDYLKADGKAFFVLQKWKQQTKMFNVTELKRLITNHLDDVDKHTLCKAIRKIDVRDGTLNHAILVSHAYEEFRHACALRITYKYLHFGLELGLTLADIERIEMQKKIPLERVRGILDRWHETKKEDAKVAHVVSAFQRCGLRNLEWIEEEYDLERFIKRDEETDKCRIS